MARSGIFKLATPPMARVYATRTASWTKGCFTRIMVNNGG
jgi:hypothetical protein